MIITCEQCQARFRLADDKLKATGTKVRCSKCKHVFSVFPPEEPLAGEPTMAGGTGPATDEASAEVPPQPEPEPQPEPAVATKPAAAASSGDMDLDFSGLEESMGPGTGTGELAEEFSFAATSPQEPETDTREPAGLEAAAPDITPPFDETEQSSAELDFDNAFAETGSHPGDDAGTAEATGFTFNETPGDSGDSGGVSFDHGTAAGIGEEFSFEGNLPEEEPLVRPQDTQDSAFAFGEDTPEAEGSAAPGFDAGESAFAFGEDTPEAEGSAAPGFDAGESAFAFGEDSAETSDTGAFSFDAGESGEASPFDTATPFGSDASASWGAPESGDSSSFDFNEPSFETSAADNPPPRGNDGNMGFGEIDFSDQGGDAPPLPGPGLDFEQATFARPAEPEAPPSQPVAAPPPSASPPPRPRSEEPLPLPKRPAPKPVSRAVIGLVLLLLAICGAAGYFYYLGNGRQFVENLLLKAKGEVPATQVAPNIAISIDSSAYVDNRAAGQLLVIQGTVTNNSPGSRSAITVKGMLLDAAGKVIQQQTVFCGNFLSEEKLSTMKYEQIEEAMNNQFGDSLLNMNVKPGGALQYTIVFRNVPKEMANIAVDYSDSKAGDGG